MRDRLVLFAHGSRRGAWRAPLEALAARLGERLGRPEAVALAYLELCPPSLGEAAAAALADGVERLRVLPLFMSGGGHVAHDLPPLVEAARAACPGLRIEVLPALGEHPLVLEALAAIAADAAG
ncbi:MAG: CbiX/SirB N-terminal domain-containing protein [Myxococcales bacterium]|nr:CbiX/SirB N-terminal domain-containing protein [Myxococcales bacterium]